MYERNSTDNEKVGKGLEQVCDVDTNARESRRIRHSFSLEQRYIKNVHCNGKMKE